MIRDCSTENWAPAHSCKSLVHLITAKTNTGFPECYVILMYHEYFQFLSQREVLPDFTAMFSLPFDRKKPPLPKVRISRRRRDRIILSLFLPGISRGSMAPSDSGVE